MILTQENYYGKEANEIFFSVSQYKDFCRCEAAALAKIRGEYNPPPTKAMLVGSFVDAWVEGTLDTFKQNNPSLFTRKGELLAEFKKAEELIDLIASDDEFMQFLGGEKQKILTFDLLGVPWKMKMDSYDPEICITDLKVVKDFDSMPFWRHDIQGAMYQYGVQDKIGEKLPFYLAVVTKETVPDHDIFQIPQDMLDMALREVEQTIGHYAAVKSGFIDPKPCGKCEYCRQIKKATVRNYKELMK